MHGGRFCHVRCFLMMHQTPIFSILGVVPVVDSSNEGLALTVLRVARRPPARRARHVVEEAPAGGHQGPPFCSPPSGTTSNARQAASPATTEQGHTSPEAAKTGEEPVPAADSPEKSPTSDAPPATAPALAPAEGARKGMTNLSSRSIVHPLGIRPALARRCALSECDCEYGTRDFT